ncbi:MAG: hypothetical protein LBM77_11155 [Spirochaetaceae bacterium]|jgi:hypothetical protein|nr:hypothetical protein [Spirochaetaceae bacterium]
MNTKHQQETPASAFIRGMGSLDLFPDPLPYPETSMKSAWESVGDAFRATGNSLRWAMGQLEAELKENGRQ